MTASPREDPLQRTGFRFAQLAAAFDRVMNPRDWKAPIRAVIPAEDRHVVEKAVLWFTDTHPEFIEVPGEPVKLVVTAPGYRKADRAVERAAESELPTMHFNHKETI